MAGLRARPETHAAYPSRPSYPMVVVFSGVAVGAEKRNYIFTDNHYYLKNSIRNKIVNEKILTATEG